MGGCILSCFYAIIPMIIFPYFYHSPIPTSQYILMLFTLNLSWCMLELKFVMDHRGTQFCPI